MNWWRRFKYKLRWSLAEWWNDTVFRRRYHSKAVVDLAKQIEGRLAMVHSLAPDVAAAYALAKKLNEKLSAKDH